MKLLPIPATNLQKTHMPYRLLAIILTAFLFVGCASVSMEERQEVVERAKSFPAPSQGNAGVYVYRDGLYGAGLRKVLWIDKECLGQSAAKVFFYREVAGNQEHTIATESEFSPNTLKVWMDAGKNYFIRQYIRIGVFIGQADLELIDEEKGKAAVKDLSMAAGDCMLASSDEDQ